MSTHSDRDSSKGSEAPVLIASCDIDQETIDTLSSQIRVMEDELSATEVLRKDHEDEITSLRKQIEEKARKAKRYRRSADKIMSSGNMPTSGREQSESSRTVHTDPAPGGTIDPNGNIVEPGATGINKPVSWEEFLAKMDRRSSGGD